MLHFLPEILTAGLIFALLVITLRKNVPCQKNLALFVATMGALIAIACFYTLGASTEIFYGSYRIDALSQGFKLLFCLCLITTAFFSAEWNSVCQKQVVEYYLFMTSGLFGMMMMASTSDILTLFVALELSAYSLYLLSALRRNEKNAESSMKYLIFGAASSGASVWGLSLIFGLSGTLSLPSIAAYVQTQPLEPAFVVGSVLFLLSLLFKLSCFPMHFWAPDTYENASTPAVNFIATASKAAAVVVFIRIFLWLDIPATASMALGALAFFSMTIGNTAALLQKDVKRLLAYSSVAQAGYLLLGLLAGTPRGYSACFFYAFAYVVMNSGAFLVTLLVAKNTGNDNPQISDFDGLAEKSPFAALILLLSLLSLAGIPPLLGFTGKWFLLTAPMEKGHWFLVLWAVLNSVVSLFYYLTLVKHSYLMKPHHPKPMLIPLSLKLLGLALLVLLLFVGIYPDGFIGFAEHAVTQAL